MRPLRAIGARKKSSQREAGASHEEAKLSPPPPQCSENITRETSRGPAPDTRISQRHTRSRTFLLFLSFFLGEELEETASLAILEFILLFRPSLASLTPMKRTSSIRALSCLTPSQGFLFIACCF